MLLGRARRAVLAVSGCRARWRAESVVLGVLGLGAMLAMVGPSLDEDRGRSRGRGGEAISASQGMVRGAQDAVDGGKKAFDRAQ